MSAKVSHIPIDSIQPEQNDRKAFDQIALQELAESIRAHGLVQPITVRPIAEDGYEIVADERRWRAVHRGASQRQSPGIVAVTWGKT